MIKLYNLPNYIIIKNIKELADAKRCPVCLWIILDTGNEIIMWTKNKTSWIKETYSVDGNKKVSDDQTTGLKAYQSFYSYCGREEIERMKDVYSPIPIWDSVEQIHYCNYEYANTKMYKEFYCFDANSAFTYGANILPSDFDLLKEYLNKLFILKQESNNPLDRKRYKNMQNYLIGYFARIKKFIRVRSNIIDNSNFNIKEKMIQIRRNGGEVYLSNTDSIVTDIKGAYVMQDFIGNGVGQFKLEKIADRLYYKSPNAYQLGDKLVYGGVRYFARKHTDFFNDLFAKQEGQLIRPKQFEIDGEFPKICYVEYGQIIVTVCNKLGEEINKIIYKLED